MENGVKGIDLGELVDWVNESDDATLVSRTNAEKSRDYYDSKQLTEAEVKELKKRKQAPVVVNRVKPKMDGLAGMERANKTTAKAYPRTPKHDDAATAATEAIRFVLQDNNYSSTRSACWENLTIEGTGGCEVIAKDVGGKIRLTINHIMWDRIVYDPHSRRKDFADARYLGQVVWMDYDIACDLYPEKKDLLEQMQSGSETYDDKPRWMDSRRNRVKIVELYYHEGKDVKYACFTRGGFLKGPEVSPYVDEEGNTEWPYEFASLFVDREGQRYGAAFQYLDVQDEINKRRSKALHLMSVRQTFGTAGAVQDVNAARQQLAKPDGHLEVAFGEFGKDFGVLPTSDMAQAQFKLLEESKMEIDAVGFSAAASGKESRNMSGVALRNREAASQTELAPMFDILKGLDVRVYRKVWNRIKQYWKEEMWIRVTDNEETLQWVGLNRPITKGEQALNEAKKQGARPEQLQALQAQLSQDPMSQEMVTENNVAELDMDIVIDDAPDSVTMQQEEFTALGEMVKSGIPIPPTAIVAASSLKDKDKILKEMREGMAVPPELQEKMQKMDEEMQKLAQENQALKADQQTEIAKVQLNAQAKQAELQQKAASQAKEIRLEQEKLQAEIALERERASAQIQLEREKAAAQIEIELMKAKAQVDLEKLKIETQADGEVDKAIGTVKNLASQHEAKVQNIISVDEAKKEKAEGKDAKAESAKMQDGFKNVVEGIVRELKAKKKIKMTMPDGRQATAEVG